MANTWNLRITDRRGRAKVHTLGTLPVVLGRDETLPIPIDDPQSSRRHCQIDAVDEKSFRVSDLNSTNGTLLNGRKITRAVVSDGDRIKIGETIIEFMRVQEVSVEDDTGMRRLSVLKSFSSPQAKAAAGGAPSPLKVDEKAVVLSRIGASAGGGSPVVNQRLTLVAEVGHILTEVTNLEEILKMILSGLLEVYPIDRIAVLVKNEQTQALEPTVSRAKDGLATGLIVSRTICHHILQTGEAIITENAVADPRFSSGDSIIEHRVGSVIAAPITARGSLLGVLYACTQERAAHFADHDLSFLALVGNLVALAILLDRNKPVA